METMFKDNFHEKTGKLKTKRYKYIIIIITLIICIGSILLIKEPLNITSITKTTNELREKIYNSMLNKENRIKAYNRAIYLNDGDTSNTCVYFLSEVLRMNGMKISDNICNTTQILYIMKQQGFKIERDYKKLKPGDICFTTDQFLNKKGTPTHTYIFMGWKEEGKYDYAYICDNQAKDYDGNIYHLRNIVKLDKIKGNTKEPFSFFMYK